MTSDTEDISEKSRIWGNNQCARFEPKHSVDGLSQLSNLLGQKILNKRPFGKFLWPNISVNNKKRRWKGHSLALFICITFLTSVGIVSRYLFLDLLSCINDEFLKWTPGVVIHQDPISIIYQIAHEATQGLFLIFRRVIESREPFFFSRGVRTSMTLHVGRSLFS